MRRVRALARAIVVSIPLAALVGCATGRGSRPAEPPPSSADARPQQGVSLFRSDGSPASIDDIVRAMSEADVVLIGETHGHPVGLALAADIWDRVAARSPGAALALEFIERDSQAHLDDYLSGVTTEEQFRKASGRTPGNYPEGHRAMLERAKAAGVPVAASNAPRRYVRLARLEGFARLAALTEAQRRLFVIPPTLPTGRYRDEFFSMMGGMPTTRTGDGGGGHAGEGDRREQERTLLGFFRSQAMWDATMADSIRALRASGRRPVVQVVGRFHSDFEGGLAQYLRAQMPEARIVSLSVSPETRDQLPAEDFGRADFIALVGPAPEPEKAADAASAPGAEKSSQPATAP